MFYAPLQSLASDDAWESSRPPTTISRQPRRKRTHASGIEARKYMGGGDWSWMRKKRRKKLIGTRRNNTAHLCLRTWIVRPYRCQTGHGWQSRSPLHIQLSSSRGLVTCHAHNCVLLCRPFHRLCTLKIPPIHPHSTDLVRLTFRISS